MSVAAVNDAPTAVNDTGFSTTQGNSVTLTAAQLVVNDTDPDTGDVLHVSSVDFVGTNGTAILNGDGTVTFTPSNNYNGPASFTYRVADSSNVVSANTATVSVTVVDNVKPTAVDVQTTNGGGTAGLIQQGDTISYTFSEPIDPNTILAGWNGSATNVTVRVYDGNILANILGGNDTLQVFNSANNTLLPLGTVDMGRSDYATSLLGGLLGSYLGYSNSTMTLSGNTVTIKLGSFSPSGTILGLDAVGRGTAGSSGTHAMTWIPTAGPKDLAANALIIANAAESGADDKDF